MRRRFWSKSRTFFGSEVVPVKSNILPSTRLDRFVFRPEVFNECTISNYNSPQIFTYDLLHLTIGRLLRKRI